jgi:hypothetical protein
MNGNKYNVCFVIIFLIINLPLKAALAPYIPSYDDRYEDDLEQARGNKDYFKEPSDELNYTQYHYVGAHSAERYPRFFPSTAALQDQPIPGLLATGVRGLMLTTFDWSLSWSSILKEGRSVVLSYPKQESTVFQKNGKPLYQTLHYEMNRIFNFLKTHPKAVITVLFEDYAEPSKMVRDIQEIIMKNNYDPILRPSDWSAAQQKGTWPTLGWMRKNNKRLILFTQVNEEHTNFTWPEKNYFWKNMTGTMDETVACSQLQHKAPLVYQPNRSLVSFGCYGNPSITPDKRNCLSYNSVKDLTIACQKKGFASGKLFNGYWADYIVTVVNALVRDHKKTVFDYVNELNVLKRK